MKSEEEIRERIKKVEAGYSHVLTGDVSNIFENAPRALMQIDSETQLVTLHWVLGLRYISKLKKRGEKK